MVKKLNLGSGRTKREGFLNVDALDWEGNTDIKHDLTIVPFPFSDESIDEIYSTEFLEHISFRDTKKFLQECWRILKPDGLLTIQVPDAGKAMEYYVNKEICSCVPHKAVCKEDFKADPDCFDCHGKGKINPMRWQFTFTGAQKHLMDTHKNIFTKESLKLYLEDTFFTNIDFKDNPFKLIVTCNK